MKKKVEKYFEFLSLTVLIVLIVIILLYFNFQQNSSIDDSSAIYGGKDEKGYLSAGYLVTYENSNTVRSCGLFFIDNTTAITAAHCVENGKNFYVGEKEFSYLESENVEVKEVIIHPSWDGENRNYDIAIVKFSPQNFEIAQIADIELGCGYEIVGYGSTEIDSLLDPGVRLRKSYSLCIEGFSGNSLYISGESGGVCFGDSGSPIFKAGTNQVVGILSAVLELPGEKDKYCAIGNSAIAVRVSKFRDYISKYQNLNSLTNVKVCGESCIIDSNCSTGLTCQNNRCLNPDGRCVATLDQFCSIESNITCDTNYSCLQNRCVQKTVFANQATNQSLTLSSTQINFVDEYRNELVLIISLALIINFFGLFKIVLTKN
ncbi:MAG: hypothetical protein KatS3mg085_583 [Candidatus Dojkabacteria bacterium]|nr:MAG: hypothetical protein KatS3mg085_583 [Candidatus Dojkabacteria bacterium]